MSIEQRAVIKYYTKLGKQATKIETKLCKVYGDNTPSYSAITFWVREFKRGREELESDPRSGRPSTAVTEETIDATQKLVYADRRIKVKEIEAALGIGRHAIFEILHDHLNLSKISARWVPRLLTQEQMEQRSTSCLEMMHTYDRDPLDFHKRVVTGDETWIFSYDPESKQMSMQWLEKGSRGPTKAKVVKSASKTMMTLFFDSEGVLLADFLEKGATINGQYYANLLIRLRESIKQTRRGKLTAGVLLLDDNAPVHRAGCVLDLLHEQKWARLSHPPYSPDLAPCDFRVFPDLKKSIKGVRFTDQNELQSRVLGWLDERPKEYWEKAFCELRERWQVCFNRDGNYVEK